MSETHSCGSRSNVRPQATFLLTLHHKQADTDTLPVNTVTAPVLCTLLVGRQRSSGAPCCMQSWRQTHASDVSGRLLVLHTPHSSTLHTLGWGTWHVREASHWGPSFGRALWSV